MSAAHPLRRWLADAGILAADNDRPHPTVDLTGLPTAPAGDPAAARYATKALEYEADAVAHTPEGGRNDALNRAAYKLGSLVSAGHLDKHALLERLWHAARTAGLPDHEIRRVIGRAARDGAATPRAVHLAGTNPNLTVVPDQNMSTQDEPHRPAGSADHTDDSPQQTLPDVIQPALDWHTVYANASAEPEWLARPLFERGNLYAVYSPAKAGKSLFMLDVCAALAAGRGPLGQPPGAPVDVLYVDLENTPRDLYERLTALDYQPDDLTRLHYLSFPTLPALDSPRGGAYLAANAEHYHASVVVIDTVGRTVAGEENTADTWHALYRCAMVPLKAAGVCVIRLDHLGKDAERGMRGSSAKVSDVDTAYALTRLPGEQIRVDRTATRNGHSPESVLFDVVADPLRHVPADLSERDSNAVRLVGTLERLGIPHGMGRDRVRQILAEQGIAVRTETLAQALRMRRYSLPPTGE